ncbi:MAG: DUF1540 domain-containing protein [Armatimonadota bacterium]
MPEVRCTVCNCEYWDEGNACSAGQILITAGGVGTDDPAGEQAARLPATPIPTAAYSLCRTYTPRGSEDPDEVETGSEVEANLDLPLR